jgi:hypothetical protein
VYPSDGPTGSWKTVVRGDLTGPAEADAKISTSTESIAAGNQDGTVERLGDP